MQPALGLANGTVMLVAYDPRWPSLFEAARAELAGALGDAIQTVHHVGSTSVPGLIAKPLLDLLVTVADLETARALVPRLAALGYELDLGDDIPDRLFFHRRTGPVRTHHLSLAEPSSHYASATLTFRNALRADEQLATDYAQLKRQLAERYPRDRAAYLNGKTDFVLGVLAHPDVHTKGQTAPQI